MRRGRGCLNSTAVPASNSIRPCKEFGPSSSGKTIIIASTEGNVSVPVRDEKVGLNVYRKKV
jgi:hypothetical protein